MRFSRARIVLRQSLELSRQNFVQPLILCRVVQRGASVERGNVVLLAIEQASSTYTCEDHTLNKA
jgi:hypothetical protein